MKKTIVTLGLVSIGLITMLTGCSMPDMTDKSVDASVGGVGGAFTTSFDSTSGTPTPSMKMGELNGSITTHKIGDGDQLHFTQDKSFWGSEVGSTVIKYNAKGNLKKLTIIAIPQGQLTVEVAGYDDSTDADSVNVETALKKVK